MVSVINDRLAFADLIIDEERIKAKIKTEFVREITQQRHQYNQLSQAAPFDEIGAYSWLNNMNIDDIIRCLVLQRSHLKTSVGLLPVYHHSAFLMFAQNKVNSSRMRNKFDDVLLEWYLEGIIESKPSLLGNPFKNCTQLIIPFHLREHYSVAVIHLSKNNSKKFATIQYYDPLGQKLDEALQRQLKNYFTKQGFMVKFQCLSRQDQQDDYNCGVFITLKAIDIVNKNAGNDEVLLTVEGLNQKSYHDFFNYHRYQMVNLLNANGRHVYISPALSKNLNK